MLEKSFIHVPGVNPESEVELWKQGCATWQDFLDHPDGFHCEGVERKKLLSGIKRSLKAKQLSEHQYFRRSLGPRQAWRAYPDFKHSCVFLDIETDGRTGGGSVTTVGLYDGKEFRALVKNEDLGNFPDIISQYSMIVTFFGTGFDLPVLHKRFPLIRMDQIHIDLCPVLKQLGFQGGLKRIEKQLGITRSDETDGLTGRDAIHLWRRYEQLRDERALARLIAYNREDVVNLETLADYAYGKLWGKTYGKTQPAQASLEW